MRNPIIVALDVDTTDEALQLIETIGEQIDFYKIGMELYAVAGMEFVRKLTSSFGKKVFLDLKLYDISETVKRATQQICKNDVAFLTVHARKKVMDAAVEGKGASETKLLAVTVLTNFNQADLIDLGYSATMTIPDLVELRVRQAVKSGIDGIVCSPLEVAKVREIVGDKLQLVTPGVRSTGAAVGDQKRVATPREAIQSGADYVVMGRQVTRASDPRAECERILDEIFL
jgi:orotidine-5'-phosphate decarboxylase